MPRSVERWLETFMCKQYADIFDAYGFKTLHSVCQLQIQQLQSMRIPSDHCEVIMQNVQMLRQSMSDDLKNLYYQRGMMQQQHPQQPYGGEEMGHYNNRMAHGGNSGTAVPGGGGRGGGMPGMQYQARDMGPQQQHMSQMGMNPGGYSPHMSGGNGGNYGNHRSAAAAAAMMSQQHQFSNQAMYQQHMQQQQQQQQQQQYMAGSHHQYPVNPSMGMSPHAQNQSGPHTESSSGEMNYQQMGNNSPSKAMYRQNYAGKVQGSAGQGQGNIHQTHPHLRNIGQNPQDVANTILQMASSNYPPSHTVQVPLSKNRAAPYHIPSRSPQYDNSNQPPPQAQQHNVMTPTGSQGQFVYPSTSPHHQPQQQQHMRMSPVSPASGNVMGMLPSPHSHHSGHSISSSSPCSLHSPGARDMQSPASDMNTSLRRTPSNMMPHSQQMASPQRGQYPITSPGNTPHHQRMVSPVPTNQQLQVSCSLPQQQKQQQQQHPMYRESMSAYAGSHPHGQSMSQYPAVPGSQHSPGGQSCQSVNSNHSGNIPSPYNTQGSKSSASFSPNQSYNKQQQPPSPYVEPQTQQNMEKSLPNINSNNSTTDPLQSLQKLCMLPERQVVDPKSVVNDACAPSPQNSEFPKNCHMNADSQGSNFWVEGQQSESASPHMDTQCVDGRNCTPPAQIDNTTSVSYNTELQHGQQKTYNDNSSGESNVNSYSETNEYSYHNKTNAFNKNHEHFDVRKEMDKDDTSSVNDIQRDKSYTVNEPSRETSNVPHEIDEVRCQPKKLMLLRAQEEFKESFLTKHTEVNMNVRTDLQQNNDKEPKSLNKTELSQPKQTSPESVNCQATEEKHKLESSQENIKENTCEKNSENNAETNPMTKNETSSIKEPTEIVQISEQNTENKSDNVGDKTIESNSDNISESKESHEQTAESIEDEHSTVLTVNETEKVENDSHVESTEQENIESEMSVVSECTTIQTQSTSQHLPKTTVELSDSDAESQLVVRKDIKSTYSKVDRFKDGSSRSRGHSTGSLSDEAVSDMEYEDHIGCDDIDNDYSYSDDKEEIIEIDENEEPDLVYEVTKSNNVKMANGINDKMVVTSPHWKKSRLSDLQAVETNPCSEQNRNGTINGETRTVTKRKARRVNGTKTVSSVRDVIEIDCDDDDVPSPAEASIIDIEGGTGGLAMMGVTRAHHRTRKTPLKFKDTSFFQGDFIFEGEDVGDDEDNDDDEIYIPKKKCLKKGNPADLNHNTKKVEEFRKRQINCNKNKMIKRDSSKEKKQKQNMNAKSKQLKSKYSECNGNSYSSDETDNEDNTINGEDIDGVGFKGSDKKTKRTSKNNHNKEKQDVMKTESAKKPFSASARKTLTSKSETAATSKECSKQTGNTVAKTRESVKKKTAKMPKEEKKVFNGQMHSDKNETNKLSKDKADNKKKDSKHFNGIKRMNSQESHIEKEETRIKNVSDGYQTGVIKIEDPEDSVDAVVTRSSQHDSNIHIKQETPSQHNHSSKIKQETVSYKDADIYKFEINKDVDCKAGISMTGVNHADSSGKVNLRGKGTGKRGPDLKPRKPKRKPGEVEYKSVNSKDKSASKKRKRNKYDCDFDYEIDSSKNSIKEMNLNKTQTLLSSQKKKDKRDKWADFKGPLIRLEGAKETPDRCIVINEPLDHTDSKKRKTPSQAVTSVHISHLPPDKSIFMPHTEAEEGNRWMCALCGKHSSYKFLGDLFGPYTVEVLAEDMSDFMTHQELKRKKAESTPQPGSSKSSRFSKRVPSVSKEVDMFKEVWVHEACAVWSDGVFLIADKIYGLQEAVKIASQTPCSHCLEMGAMIGCLNKGCQQKFHQACAIDNECFLDEENYSLLCPKHKVRKLKQLAAGSGNVT